ncbi:MAG: sigma-54-dependent Fis family transcriptional regulator [Myxococcales bacterium]|nr:sigma-54-dependent Fis family transcriptional regulator [Myxococcales bacterium]
MTGDKTIDPRGSQLEIEAIELAVARLRLLYHFDLDRIGALSARDALATDGSWQTVGRFDPSFVTAGPDARSVTLDDPAISRSQLRCRWLAETQQLEVEPLADARRTLHLVEPAGMTEIAGPVRLERGQCIAIGDRALLGLEVSDRPDAASDERLGLVGECQAMWRLREQIRWISKLGRPALILGETGAGKELVASAIHQRSARAQKPFVRVNCAALPEQLVESLLFGHRKGAFTDASSDNLGQLRAADGGTLFLDELGEMPLAMQPKLLRVIEDGEVTAVGQTASAKVDVRFLAATNRDPAEEMRCGRLRQDLYFRLAAHIVKVPPLRERRFDIPALFVHLLARFRDEHPIDWLWRDTDGPWRSTIPLSFFVALLQHDWPGNVRQLQNVVERTVSHNLGGRPFRAPYPLGPDDLPTPAAATEPAADSAPAATPTTPPMSPSPTTTAAASDRASKHLDRASELLDIARKTTAKLLDDHALDDIFRGASPHVAPLTALEARASERLLALLGACDFKQKQTAEQLGVSLSTLTKLMLRFGVPRPNDLSESQIRQALDAAGGDVDAAARALKISAQGLKKRLTALQAR